MALDEMAELVAELRSFVRDELAGVYTMHLVVVRDYDAERQRCVVALKDDPEVQVADVPIATPLAGDGYGDLYPITPGETEGIALFSRVPLDDLLKARGPQSTPQHRRHAVEDAVFMPAMVFYDDDDVPTHDEGDRLIVHPSGSLIRLAASGAVAIEHPSGMTIDIGAGATDAVDVGRLALSHPVGVDLSVSDAGVAIDSGEDAGVTQGVPSLGSHTDPHRTELPGHRHLVEHDDGMHEITGPPLTHRELFRYTLAAAHTDDIANPASVADLQAFYDHWLAWLEREAGADFGAGGFGEGGYGRLTLDPATSAWPDPEPIPSPPERDSFDGVVTVRGTRVPVRSGETDATETVPGWDQPDLDDLA